MVIAEVECCELVSSAGADLGDASAVSVAEELESAKSMGWECRSQVVAPAASWAEVTAAEHPG